MDSGKWIYLCIKLLLVSWFYSVDAQDKVSAVVGKKAVLQCVLSFSGNPQVMWIDPRNQLISVNTDIRSSDRRYSVQRPYQRMWELHIDNVKTSDAGRYECRIMTSPAQVKPVELEVQVGPTIDSSSDDATKIVGQDITFSCTAKGWPTPTISWYKYSYNGQREDLKLTGGTMSLRNMSRFDAGQYECEANNAVPPIAKAQMKLDILFAPEITIPYGQISQQEGKDTLLECIVVANPHTSTYWAKDGRRLEDSSKYKIHMWDVGQYTKNLGAFVYDLVEADYGQYACVASNNYGRDEDTVNLYEWHTGHIRILQTPVDAISAERQGVLFNCTVDGLSHRDTLTWYRKLPGEAKEKIFASGSSSQVYLDSNKYEIRGYYNLFIKSVLKEDAGEYICEVSGHNNYTAQLTVVETVKCENKNVNGSSVEEGTAAMLECGLVFSGYAPVWEVEWAVADTKLSSVNLDQDGQLLRRVAFPASIKDTGIYTCTISTKLPRFTGTCNTELDVIRVLPTASPACGVKVAQMSQALLITAAVGGGLLIVLIIALCYAVIHYRRELRKCKSKPELPNLTQACGSNLPPHGPPSVRYTSVDQNGARQETSTLMPSRKDLMSSSTTPEAAGAPALPVRRPLTSQLSEDHQKETSSLLRKEARPAVEAPRVAPPPPSLPPPEEEEEMEERAPLATRESLFEAEC